MRIFSQLVHAVHMKSQNRMSIEQAYYMLDVPHPLKLSKTELNVVCERLLAFSPESILSDVSITERAQKILDHDNISENVFNQILTFLDPAEMVHPYSVIAPRLLRHPRMTKDKYHQLVKFISHDPVLVKDLLRATEESLERLGFVLTYKVVLFRLPHPFRNKKVFTEPNVTLAEHQQDQKTYRILVKGMKELRNHVPAGHHDTHL